MRANPNTEENAMPIEKVTSWMRKRCTRVERFGAALLAVTSKIPVATVAGDMGGGYSIAGSSLSNESPANRREFARLYNLAAGHSRLRLTMVMIVVTAIQTLLPLPAAGGEYPLFTDNFDWVGPTNGDLDPRWHKDLPARWGGGSQAYLWPEGSFLTIFCPNTQHFNMWNERDDAPIVWTDAPQGSYYVETKVWLDNYTDAQVAGIVVYDGPDGANGIFTLGINTWPGQNKAIWFQRLGDGAAAKWTVPGIVPGTPGSWVRLRFYKYNGEYTGAAARYIFLYNLGDSEDGWITLDDHSQNWWTSWNYWNSERVSRVGLFLKTGQASNSNARFDYFKMVSLIPKDPPAEPLKPEEGSRTVDCPALSSLSNGSYDKLFIQNVKHASGGVQLQGVKVSAGAITSIGGGTVVWDGELSGLLGDYFKVQSGHSDGSNLYITVAFRVPEILGGTNASFEFILTPDCALAPVGVHIEIPGTQKKDAFIIERAFLDILPGEGKFGGGGFFGPSSVSKTFGGWLEFRSGIGPVVDGRRTVDVVKVGVGAGHLAIPIGSTGAFLEYVSAGIENPAGLSDPRNFSDSNLIGQFDVVLGRPFDVVGQEIYPYKFTGTGVFDIHDGSFDFNGSGKLCGKIETSNVRLVYNPPYSIAATGSFNEVIYSGSFTLHQENGNFSGNMHGNLKLPDDWDLIGGWHLAGVDASFSNGSRASGNVKITVVPAVEVCLPCVNPCWPWYDCEQCPGCHNVTPGTYASFGFSMDLTSGEIDFSGFNIWVGFKGPGGGSGVARGFWTPLAGAAGSARSGATAPLLSKTFTVDSPAPAVIFRAAYSGDVGADRLLLRVRTPSGASFDSSSGALPDGYQGNSGFSRFHPEAKELFIYLIGQPAGDYEVTVDGDLTAGVVELQAAVQNGMPSARLVSVLPGPKSGQYTVNWTDSDVDGKNAASISLSPERNGDRGFLLTRLEDTANTGAYTFDTFALSIPSGIYFVKLAIDDGVNAPLNLYSDEPITVNPSGLPGPPGHIQFSPGDGSFKIRWTASPTPGVIGYRVEWTEDHEDYQVMEHSAWVPANGEKKIAAEVNGLVNGRPVLVQVIAIGSDSSRSAPSEIIRLTPRGTGKHAPIIVGEHDDDAVVGHLYFNIPAMEDFDQGKYTWSLSTAPAGMTIEPNSGMIKWVPVAEDEGPHEVMVEVSESADVRTTASFTLFVYPADLKNGLEQLGYKIMTHPIHDAEEGKDYVYQPKVIGPDNNVKFKLLSGPNGMAMDAVSGQIMWKVPIGAGSSWVRFAVTVGGSYELNQDWYLFVRRDDQVLETADSTGYGGGCSCSSVGL
jgi:hypothetical protein